MVFTWVPGGCETTGLDDQDAGVRHLIADQAGVGAARRAAPDDDDVHLIHRLAHSGRR
jgi:hypothetical protein